MSLEPILDINKLSNYINNIRNKYNNSIKVDEPIKHFYTETILNLVSLIITKQILFDKNFWNQYGILLDESQQMKKIIKSIEKKKFIGQGANGTVYKVKSKLFTKKKFNTDTVAVKIEKINSENFEYFNINKLINSIKISKYATKIKLGPKLYDTFVTIQDHYNINIIKIFQYIDGETLFKKKWKSDDEKKAVFNELRKIIRKMNKAGIIHHDLHKNNIMITKSNKIYIIDYDFSKFIENEEQINVNYMANNYSSSAIISKKLINYVYNNCINDGIIILPK
jgi:tRNA A-37 threonylcarbamoyl transferase component Bud32